MWKRFSGIFLSYWNMYFLAYIFCIFAIISYAWKNTMTWTFAKILYGQSVTLWSMSYLQFCPHKSSTKAIIVCIICLYDLLYFTVFCNQNVVSDKWAVVDPFCNRCYGPFGSLTAKHFHGILLKTASLSKTNQVTIS